MQNNGEKWRYLMDNSLEGILFFDSEGKVVEANQTAKMELGYEGELAGKEIYRIFPKNIFWEEGQIKLEDESGKQWENQKTIETVAYR